MVIASVGGCGSEDVSGANRLPFNTLALFVDHLGVNEPRILVFMVLIQQRHKHTSNHSNEPEQFDQGCIWRRLPYRGSNIVIRC